MEFRVEKSFEDYIEAVDKTTKALLSQDDDYVRAIRRHHAFFPEVLWPDTEDLEPLAALLSLNAFMLYMSAVRVALTGHAAATYPLLRTALEAACYAFLISHDPSKAKTWLDRHKGKAEREACRKAFTSAAKLAARKLNKIEPGMGKIVIDAYEASIDFGAHPNAKSVLHHVSAEETEAHYEVSLAGLWGLGSPELGRSLVACLDMGFAIGLTLAFCLPDPSPAIRNELAALNDAKERAVRAS